MSLHLVEGAGRARWRWAIVVGLAFTLGGCSGKSGSWRNPFAVTSHPEHKGTVGGRIAELQRTAENVSLLSAAEQMQISTRLARTLPEEPHPAVRREIATALGQFTTPAAVKGLQMAVADADREVRIAACESLAEMHTAESEQILAAVLQSDTDVDVRLAATRCLAGCQHGTGFGALRNALEDPDPAVQYVAIQSLRESSGQDVGNDLAEWKRIAQQLSPSGASPETVGSDESAWR